MNTKTHATISIRQDQYLKLLEMATKQQSKEYRQVSVGMIVRKILDEALNNGQK